MCTQDIPQYHHGLSHTLCPKMWACILYKLKETPSNINVLVLIYFVWGAFKTVLIKMIHFFKTLSFGMHPQLTNMDCVPLPLN
jgi:hypothetical protein